MSVGPLLAAVAAAAVVIVPTAVAANEKPPNHDPTELWHAYPLGKPQPSAPTASKSSRPQTPSRPSPARPHPTTPVRSSTPLPQPEPRSSFPIAAVSSVAGGAVTLLLLTLIVVRRRRGDGGSPAVIVEPPPGKPPTDPVVMKVWPQDIESPVTVRVRRAMAQRAPDEVPLPFEGRKRARATVASSAARWNTLGRQVLPRRRDSVSDGLQETVVSESAVQPSEGSARGDFKTAGGGRGDIGERINEILRAAEEAAKQVCLDAEHEAAAIRARAETDAKAHHETVLEQAKQVREEAEGYATETKQAVDSYATQKRREVEAEVGQLHREAETQARAVREAAEEMAKQLEAEARRKQQELDEGSHVIEVRLERLLGGIRETGSQLEALMGRGKGESLVTALSVERQRLSSSDRES